MATLPAAVLQITDQRPKLADAMYSLGVSDHIMIAHRFTADIFPAPTHRLHGATYAVDVEIRVPSLGPEQVVMEIGALRDVLRRVLDPLDYQNLDAHPAFPDHTATAERVAAYIADAMAQALGVIESRLRPPPGATIRVVIRESPVAWVAFERTL